MWCNSGLAGLRAEFASRGVRGSNLLSSTEFTGRFRTRHRPSPFRCSSTVRQSPVGGGVLLGRAGEVGPGVKDGSHPLPRLLTLGRDVLGGPVPLVRAVALE